MAASVCLVIGTLGSGCSPDHQAAPPPAYKGPLILEGIGRGNTATEYRDGARLKIERRIGRCTFHRLYSMPAGKSYSWSFCQSGGHEVEIAKISLLPEPHFFPRSPQAKSSGVCSVAGEAGTVWRFRRPANIKGANGEYDEACISADGIVLQEALLLPDLSGRQVNWTATRVTRERPPQQVFDPPA